MVLWRERAKRVLPREHTAHSKHSLPTTQEKTLHMNFTSWSILKSDWLYSLQSKMEKLWTVSKNKTWSWLWLRSWTAAAAKSLQSCLTPCDPIDCGPPGSPVPGILQARIPDWVAMLSSRGSFQPRDRTQVSRIAGRFFTSWATREAQEYSSGYPIPSPADLLDPGIEPGGILYQLSYEEWITK